jgi:ribonuclease Z
VIEVIFIGTGPSIPPPGQGNTALVARSAHSAVLLECGPTVPTSAQNIGVELRLIPYIFLSHGHGDHMLGFPLIVLDRLVTGQTMRLAPLQVFCPDSLADRLQRLCRDVFPETREILKSITWHPLPEDQVTTLELEPDLRLTSGPVGGYPATPTLGVRLDFEEGISLAYSGDTAPCEEVPQLARDCDLLVHEAYHSTTLAPGVFSGRYYHSTGRSAGIAAAQANCRVLALIHLGPYAHGREDVVAREASESFFGQVIVPADGDRLRLTATEIEILKR